SKTSKRTQGSQRPAGTRPSPATSKTSKRTQASYRTLCVLCVLCVSAVNIKIEQTNPRPRRLPSPPRCHKLRFEMQIKKAVITAAAKGQRSLPMQTLIDQHGAERSVLSLIVQEAVRAGIEDICVVVFPGD